MCHKKIFAKSPQGNGICLLRNLAELALQHSVWGKDPLAAPLSFRSYFHGDQGPQSLAVISCEECCQTQRQVASDQRGLSCKLSRCWETRSFICRHCTAVLKMPHVPSQGSLWPENLSSASWTILSFRTLLSLEESQSCQFWFPL